MSLRALSALDVLRAAALIAIAHWVAPACSRGHSPSATNEPSTPRSNPSSSEATRPAARPAPDVADVRPLPPWSYPAVPRLVAIGDVHGDLTGLRSALRLAGAIDSTDHWSGGALWIVQTGDLLDRGDDERAILDLVTRLESEAERAGGRFVAINGNHEIMNAQGDFRYVTPGGYTDFASFAGEAHEAVNDEFASAMRGRAAVFAPGGRYARQFAARNTIVQVGDTVFVHGGLLPSHVDAGIETINRAVRAFFLAQSPLPRMLEANDSPLWHRAFAMADDPAACALGEEALSRLHARRMVIGHTVQRSGITPACDQHVWRVDVGLARLYAGPIEALEIAGDAVRVLHGTR
ncbi:MAG: metallophosphoesterase [Deltaproteobacteria bacterium]